MTNKILKILSLVYLFGSLASLYYFFNPVEPIPKMALGDFNIHEIGFIVGRFITISIPLYLLKISIGRLAKIYWAVTAIALLLHLIWDYFLSHFVDINTSLYSLSNHGILFIVSVIMLHINQKDKFLLFGKYEY